MPLMTGETFYGAGLGLGVALAEVPVAIYPNADPFRRQRPSGDGSSTTTAYVNQGRWIVDCPFCPSAQVAFDTDRRFFCAGQDGCGNAQVNGKFVRVVWPTPPDRAQIEQLLEMRPLVNRNWTPNEPINALAAENQHNLNGAQ